MDAFGIRDSLIEGYKSFSESFVDIRDDGIRDAVTRESNEGRQWPDPWLSLNPSFETGGRIDELVMEGLLHPECERIFRVKKSLEDTGARPLSLHKHQSDAVRTAARNASYVLTTGTGSGKSLAYIVPIVNKVLELGSGRGIKAIVVYPMNALANSQREELRKFLSFGYDDKPPVTFKRYTGQESREEREAILADPPDILLTNYVMLELVLTRPDERARLIKAAQGLSFLVLDELHTYRGRQGADVAMLVRRVREACNAESTLQCVGTSATMSSGGTVAEQQQDVAEVATRIFGTTVEPQHVITESLVRATTVRHPSPSALADAVAERGTAEFSSPTLDGGYVPMQNDPLASWIEDKFGLAQEPESGRLIRTRPTTVSRAAEDLAEATTTSRQAAETAIRATLLAGSRAKHEQTGRPLFAFRLHQFLSKGGSVYTTVEPPETRPVETDFQIVLPGETERRLYPLAFCRECGQEYLMARLTTDDGQFRFVARHELRLAESGGEDEGKDGYLFTSRTPEWPADPIAEDRLPASWRTDSETGHPVIESKRNRIPQRYRIRPDGVAEKESPSNATDGHLAAWIPGSFGFCLHCNVTYEANSSNEFSKLVTLDREGRSSAMTVIASKLVELLKSPIASDLDPEARKLLTFVDNRQDASLQAGHLNDFVQVAQLRAALYHALVSAGEEGVDPEDLGKALLDSLKLAPADYAQAPAALDPKPAQRALNHVVTYRAVRDLQRGWRITLPNLEQTGLMRVTYPNAKLLAQRQDLWDNAHYLLKQSAPGQREEIITVLLDEFRRLLAIDAADLDVDEFDKLRYRSREFLKGIWALSDKEPDPSPGIAVTESKKAGFTRNVLTVTGRGMFGRWLGKKERLGHKLKIEETNEVIASLFEMLVQHGLITEVSQRSVKGYRLKLSSMRLYAGAGLEGAPDPVRRQFDANKKPRVIRFFRDLYKESSSQLGGLRAAEHTAQVRPEDRERREAEFRTGELPLLFCSPTMELGVDIASLNAVAMRNVPPTPANYAQRSGRAGRSGQPALVLTYCATGNSHDTYYFAKSDLMVAGQVQPPRLDFANEDLIRSHVHALWMAEALSATSGGLGQSMSGLVQLGVPGYPLKNSFNSIFGDKQAAARAKKSARVLLDGLATELEPTSWWTPDWSEKVIDQAPQSFDEACNRWRELYRNAVAEREAANAAISDASATRKKRDDAKRRYVESQQRVEILLNDSDAAGQTDFYTYRYVASEGFLPGYSFPRLPLAAFIPGTQGKDSSWLQRARFLAISEFGPGSLIYHEGARYQVKRVSLPRGESAEGSSDVVLSEARICEACGYFHDRKAGIDVCESCGQPLGGTWDNLMQLQSVITRRRERISADEEERNRQGFQLVTTFRFMSHGKKTGRADATIDLGDERLATVIYGDGATVRVTNLGRSNRKNKNERGYWLDMVTGEWLSERKANEEPAQDDDEDDVTVETSKLRKMVTPYVEDRRNIAVLRWTEPMTEETATTLQFAIERGVEAVFQLEDSELASERLNDKEFRGRLLLVEAAEGGAGVLRRLQSEPGAMAKVATKALEIIHVDPETGEDTEDACVRGCYRCLLSYGNQRVHESIDRRLIRNELMDMARATTNAAAQVTAFSGGPQQLPDGVADLGHRARGLLRLLEERGLKMPARIAQVVHNLVVDLVYEGPNVSVPTAVIVQEETEEPRDGTHLVFAGWNVISIGLDEDLAAAVAAHADVFGVDA